MYSVMDVANKKISPQGLSPCFLLHSSHTQSLFIYHQSQALVVKAKLRFLLIFPQNTIMKAFISRIFFFSLRPSLVFVIDFLFFHFFSLFFLSVGMGMQTHQYRMHPSVSTSSPMLVKDFDAFKVHTYDITKQSPLLFSQLTACPAHLILEDNSSRRQLKH